MKICPAKRTDFCLLLKSLDLIFSGFQYLEQNLHMLCCPLDGHERLDFAIQTVQEVRAQREIVIGSIGHIDGEKFLARLAAFCVEEFHLVQVPTCELELQAPFCSIKPGLIWRF